MCWVEMHTQGVNKAMERLFEGSPILPGRVIRY